MKHASALAAVLARNLTSAASKGQLLQVASTADSSASLRDEAADQSGGNFHARHAHYSFIAILVLMTLFIFVTLSATGIMLVFCRKRNPVFTQYDGVATTSGDPMGGGVATVDSMDASSELELELGDLFADGEGTCGAPDRGQYYCQLSDDDDDNGNSTNDDNECEYKREQAKMLRHNERDGNKNYDRKRLGERKEVILELQQHGKQTKNRKHFVDFRRTKNKILLFMKGKKVEDTGSETSTMGEDIYIKDITTATKSNTYPMLTHQNLNRVRITAAPDLYPQSHPNQTPQGFSSCENSQHVENNTGSGEQITNKTISLSSAPIPHHHTNRRPPQVGTGNSNFKTARRKNVSSKSQQSNGQRRHGQRSYAAREGQRHSRLHCHETYGSRRQVKGHTYQARLYHRLQQQAARLNRDSSTTSPVTMEVARRRSGCCHHIRDKRRHPKDRQCAHKLRRSHTIHAIPQTGSESRIETNAAADDDDDAVHGGGGVGAARIRGFRTTSKCGVTIVRGEGPLHLGEDRDHDGHDLLCLDVCSQGVNLSNNLVSLDFCGNCENDSRPVLLDTCSTETGDVHIALATGTRNNRTHSGYCLAGERINEDNKNQMDKTSRLTFCENEYKNFKACVDDAAKKYIYGNTVNNGAELVKISNKSLHSDTFATENTDNQGKSHVTDCKHLLVTSSSQENFLNPDWSTISESSRFGQQFSDVYLLPESSSHMSCTQTSRNLSPYSDTVSSSSHFSMQPDSSPCVRKSHINIYSPELEARTSEATEKNTGQEFESLSPNNNVDLTYIAAGIGSFTEFEKLDPCPTCTNDDGCIFTSNSSTEELILSPLSSSSPTLENSENTSPSSSSSLFSKKALPNQNSEKSNPHSTLTDSINPIPPPPRYSRLHRQLRITSPSARSRPQRTGLTYKNTLGSKTSTSFIMVEKNDSFEEKGMDCREMSKESAPNFSQSFIGDIGANIFASKKNTDVSYSESTGTGHSIFTLTTPNCCPDNLNPCMDQRFDKSHTNFSNQLCDKSDNSSCETQARDNFHFYSQGCNRFGEESDNDNDNSQTMSLLK
ncbi:hypothetical protein PoB_003417700 [Plakobranchus ocellatus]|uniref:Uncharacterized protein n=1 Tax=Plakobranchus ocellatus TaxID=259542 RepID=A0AAV4AK95_9GAST|nr:hypothetical protein PoB_003417700 [Plakobranchus ocellatus]